MKSPRPRRFTRPNADSGRVTGRGGQVELPQNTGARLVLASDGLWDGLSCPEETIASVRHLDTQTAGARLSQLASRNGLFDDLTVMVVDVLPFKLVRREALEEKKQFFDYFLRRIGWKKIADTVRAFGF
eukprot:7566856-Pyramimonas_sp.AAC.2